MAESKPTDTPKFDMLDHEDEQQILDENLAAATDHAAFGCAFQIALGLGVECLNQLLKVYVNHFIVLNESGCPA